MQNGIALTAFILLKMCNNLFYRLCFLIYYLLWPLAWGFMWPFGPKSMERKVSNMQTLLRRYSPAIKSATVEFQKAQCVFILAIEIAAQIVVKQGSLNEGTTTLKELFINYNFIGSISISGLLPITFTLLSLHTVGMHSWYLLILSTLTVAMSAITLFSIGDFNVSPPDLERITTATTRIFSLCGSRDPTTYCLDLADGSARLTSMDLGHGAVGGNSLFFSVVILGLLILDSFGLQDSPRYKRFMTWNLHNIQLALRMKEDNHGRSILPAPTPTDIEFSHKVLNIFKECLYAMIWTWYVVLFVYFLKSLNHPGNGVTVTPIKEWTFGQIVAITVWAVPLFEFAKLLSRKCGQNSFIVYQA